MGRPGRWRVWYRRLDELHDAYFVGRWRSGLRREARRQEELLLALLFLEALGVENPAGYQTLELYPHLVESFHAWHRRAGMERFPEPGVCC
ncbi:hypothetical protein BH20ACT9_BH20ACT9_05150 [soil metagenome]